MNINLTLPSIHIDIHYHGATAAQLAAIDAKLGALMATSAEIAQGLTDLTAEVTKIGTETTTLIAKVADLEAAINAGTVTPEVQAAFDALKAQVKVVDDLVPDAPVVP